MRTSFASDRCLPWLTSQAEVRVEGDAAELAPGVELLRGRVRSPSAFRVKFAGVVGLFAAAVAFMAGARPARADAAAQGPAIATSAGAALGGLSVGAFALGRRLDRSAPGVSILCVAGSVPLAARDLSSLADGARRRRADMTWPEGHVWMITETALAPDLRARAGALGLRCFSPVGGRIAEV